MSYNVWNPFSYSASDWKDVGNAVVNVMGGVGTVASAAASVYGLYQMTQPPDAPNAPAPMSIPNMPEFTMPEFTLPEFTMPDYTPFDTGEGYVTIGGNTIETLNFSDFEMPEPVDVGAIYASVFSDAAAAREEFKIDNIVPEDPVDLSTDDIDAGTSEHNSKLKKKRADVHTESSVWASSAPIMATTFGGG